MRIRTSDTSGIVQEFHSKFYHPSNARVWFYGDDDPNQRLRIISGKFRTISFIGIFILLEFDRCLTVFVNVK